MSKHDFSALSAQYCGVIDKMPKSFTSHEFILRLAQRNQALYIEALYSYRGSLTPFQVLHCQLAKHLKGYPEIVRYTRRVRSKDIFGGGNTCWQWTKV